MVLRAAPDALLFCAALMIVLCVTAAQLGDQMTPQPRPQRARDHLSGDIGISMPPFMCLIGPAATA